MASSPHKFHIRSLSHDDIYEMFTAFNLAFSDYVIPICLSFEQFEERFLKKLKINFELSAGAFISGSLVGFIFTGIGRYEESMVAYNGGTGVVPAYRGNHLTYQLYNFLFPILRKNDVEACILEVLTENKKAISVYKNIGFKESKYFHCFRKSLIDIEFYKENHEAIKLIRYPNWELLKSFSDVSPSFLDSYDVFLRNIINEETVVFEKEGIICGYAIYQPVLGRITQLAVVKDHRRKGVGTALVDYIVANSQTIAVTAMNINSESPSLINFLNKLGFENQIDQYEMYLPLT